MRAARLALCCVAAASAKIGRIAAHGFVKGGQYRSAPLGRGTEAERAALEAARAAKAELDAENRLRRDSHRSWERRDNGTDRATGKSHGAHEAITAHVYAKARRALEALDPVVRDVFQRAAAPCFVFNDTGPAKRQWCHASVMSTQELVCD